MINLLPNSEKEHLLEEEKGKLILIMELIILCFLISLILIFLSIKISIASQAETQNILLAQEEKIYEKTEIRDLKKQLEEDNTKLLKLDNFYASQADITSFLNKITGLIPSGISINQITISPVDRVLNKFQITLSGKAPSRENFIELRDNLNNNKEFNQINFPNSVLVESKDINFNISFQTIIEK